MTFDKRFLAVVLVAHCAAACGGSKPAPESPVAATVQRLEGDWKLLSFTPALALEQPLQGLLDAQLQTLTVSFAADEFTAAGPGVNAGGRYQVSSAAGESFTGMLIDRQGAEYTISGQFIGAQLRFISQDPPWRGSGVLERSR
jgi:hypothetical protein